jgi:hypothetical protein
VTTDRDRILSEFIDAWNAGRRPTVDDHLARVPEEDREGLLEDIHGFLNWAPTPDYSTETLAAIRAEPEVAHALATHRREPVSWPTLLAQRRKALGLSFADLARKLVKPLGVSPQSETKLSAYLERTEHGELDPSRFHARLTTALTSVLEASREMTGGGASAPAGAPAPAFRAEPRAIEQSRKHLELMADMAATPSEQDWDEVDDLFLGRR